MPVGVTFLEGRNILYFSLKIPASAGQSPLAVTIEDGDEKQRGALSNIINIELVSAMSREKSEDYEKVPLPHPMRMKTGAA